jgi:hypothetical protein
VEQVISRDRIVLDASASKPFEIFAQLQALICFPLSTPNERDRIVNGICADFVEQQCELEPELTAPLRSAFPQYRKSHNRVSLAAHGEKWGEALIAGWYFLRRLDPEAPGKEPSKAVTLKRVSGRHVVRDMFPAREEGFEENYESRLHDIERHLIRRHYTVAHLAAALQCAAHVSAPNGHAGEFEIHNLQFLRALVNLANGYAIAFGQTPGMENLAGQLIKLEWRD